MLGSDQVASLGTNVLLIVCKTKDGLLWEYCGVYVDDLCLICLDPQEVIDCLTNKHKFKFKLKGTGEIKFHLGMDFTSDDHASPENPKGTLCMSSSTYVEKMIATYELMSGEKPKHYRSPIKKGDHPECDSSKLLEEEGIQRYQSLIGSMQWVVSIGRIDIITTAVMTMSGFVLHQGRVTSSERKHIYGI
jgi:hypothetical protein